jgi:beta-lactamase regulating signal transducer with metallopeptidase domain
MTLPLLLGNLRMAGWVLSLLTQSLALLLIGWALAKAARRAAPPLKSGILLTLMILLVLLPLGIMVLKSGQISLYQLPVSPVGSELTRGLQAANRAPVDQGAAVARPIGQGQDALSSRTAASRGSGGLFDFRSVDPLLMALNVFGLIWLLGFIISVGRLVYGLIFLSGFRSSLVRIPEGELSGVMETVRAAFPKTRLPSIYLSAAVDSPVALGILRPMIVLPQSLAENLSAEELVNVLIHETAHIRHLDQISGLLQRLLTSLYWWNPLAYTLSASFSVTREDVSDNYAIQKSGAHSYASCLVALARKTSLITRLPAAVGMATRHMSLEDRVKNIVSKERVMATTMKKSLVVLLALASVLLTAIVVRYSWTLTAAGADVKTFALPPGVEPQVLAVDKDRIYLCEYENFTQKSESHIAVYSQSDFSLLAKIGKVGKGPGEFQVFGPSRFYVVDDQIWALDIRKTIVFANDGTFQKEIPIPRDIFAPLYPLVPIGDRFASLAGNWADVSKGNVRVFGRLYGSDLRMIKEFYGEIPLQVPPPPPPPPAPPGQKTEAKGDNAAVVKEEYQAIPECIDFAVAENKIFVADTRRGFHIAVFDFLGVPLYEINQNYVALPVPPEYGSALKKKLNETQDWLNQVADIKFRDSFPAFYSFKIADGKIYISTYAEKDGLYELVVMDLKGDILKRSFSFPLGPSYDSMYNNFNVAKDRYAISGDKIYYLAKSTKDGSYELRIQDLY